MNKIVKKRVWGNSSVREVHLVQAWDQSSDVPPNIRCGPSSMYRVEVEVGCQVAPQSSLASRFR